MRRLSREQFLALEFGANVRLIDVGDRLITPAFINAHTHLPMMAFRSIGQASDFQGNVVEDLFFRLESNLTGADIRAFARMGAFESLLAGVGCVWEHYYGGADLTSALMDVGLSGVVAPTLQDKSGPGVGQLERQLAYTQDLATNSDLQEDGVVAAVGPHATDTVSDSLWQTIAKLAETHSLPIHSHISQSVEEFERSFDEYGCSPVERLHRLGALSAAPSMLLVHSLFVGEQDLKRLKPEQHVLGYCPYSQVQFGFPAPVGAWLEHGLTVALGTDCAACNDTMNVQRELRIFASTEALQTTYSTALDQFMATGTVGDAQAVWSQRVKRFEGAYARRPFAAQLASVWSIPGSMHPQLKLGRIQQGYRANLLIFDVDHPSFWPRTDVLRALCLSDTGAAIWGMLVNGRWVGRRGEFQQSILGSEAYRETLREADERLKALLSRFT